MKKKISALFSTAVFLLLVYFPYIRIDGQRVTILALWKVIHSDLDGILAANQVYTDNPSALALTVSVQIIALCLISAFAVIRGFFAFFGKKLKNIVWYLFYILCVAAMWAQYSGYGSSALDDSILTSMFPIFPFLWGVVLFITERIAEQLRLRGKATRPEKEQEKIQKKEAKRDRNNDEFSVKLNHVFFRIYKRIWKGTALLQLFSGIGIGGVLAIVSVCFSLARNAQSANTVKAIHGIVKDAMIPFAIAFGFMIIILLVYYFDKNTENLKIFSMLGMSRTDRGIFLGEMFLAAFCLNLLTGLVFGWIFLKVLIACLKRLSGFSISCSLTAGSVGITALLFGLFFVAVLMLSHDNWSIRKYKDLSRERLPQKYLNIGMAVSAALVLIGIFLYSDHVRFENEEILAITIPCIYLFIRCLSAASVHRKTKRQKMDHLIRDHWIHSRSRTACLFATAMSFLLLYTVFCSNVQIATVQTAESMDEMYPYDVVCLAYESDLADYEELIDAYGLSPVSYPMIRVSNMDTTDAMETRGETPIQGQQIGISESTYHALKKNVGSGDQIKDLGLDDDGTSGYIVHQQDRGTRAQPLDYWLWSSRPLLRVGMPIYYMSYGLALEVEKENIGYYSRKVAGCEMGSLIGNYDCTGKQENLVVFSDSYFEKETAQMGEESPTCLLLLNGVKETDADELKQQLTAIEERHPEDFTYNSSVREIYFAADARTDLQNTRYMKTGTGLIQILLFSLTAFMTFIVEILSVSDVLKKRNRLFWYLGMEQKERHDLIRRDLLQTLHRSEAVTVVISVGLMAAMFHARGFRLPDVGRDLVYLVGIGAGVLVVWECLLRLIVHGWLGKMEKEAEDDE